MHEFQESDFEYVETVHKGAGVSVFKVRHRRDGQLYCVKEFVIYSVEHMNQINKEALAMMSLNHQSLIKLLSFYQSSRGTLWIITKFYAMGNLASEIIKRTSTSNHWKEEQLWNHMIELIDALTYMQKNEVSHRDIKPENILLEMTGETVRLLLADLGAAKRPEQAGTVIGSVLYFSPLLRRAYAEGEGITGHNAYKSDVYSLGMVFLEMASLKEIKDLMKFDRLQERIAKAINEIPYSNRIKQVILCMLRVDENQRPDFCQLTDRILGLCTIDAPSPRPQPISSSDSSITVPLNENTCIDCRRRPSIAMPCGHCYCCQECIGNERNSHHFTSGAFQICPICIGNYLTAYR